MKVLPIQPNYNKFYSDNQKQATKENYYFYNNITNLNILNKNYNQINFKRIPAEESLKMVLQIPLEDRLASLFEKIKPGDLILVGNKLNIAKTKMLENIKTLDGTIKRVFYLPEEKYQGYLGFFIDNDNMKEIYNLNDYQIKLINAENLKTDCLKPQDYFYIFDNDLVCLPGLKDALQIKLKPKTDLSNYRKNFCKAIDFTKEIKEDIEKINRKTLSQISKDTKEQKTKVTFKDVGGQDELIKELKKSILYPMKYPEMYENFDINKGFILYGPPGTGKTHISRALANEAGAHFESLNGLELESRWVGASEENWRELFEKAHKKQPTIIFIDEIDGIGRSRGSVDTNGDKVLNQLLTLISDLDAINDNVFVIGATNNFNALDKALIRSGRLSKHIEVKLPDLNGVKQIFEIHSANKPLDTKIDKEALVKRLYDIKANGGDIRYIINEAYLLGYDRAGIHAKMENKTICGKDKKKFHIIQEDFDAAIKNFIETRNGNERKAIGFYN